MKSGQEFAPGAPRALGALKDHPDMTLATIPATDDLDALEAYVAFDDGGLAEAPHALAAYVHHQRWLHA